jgi:hypothetical protein
LKLRFELFVKQRHGVRLVDAELTKRSSRSHARTVPDFSLRISGPKKQDRPVLASVEPVRREHGFGLVESREIVKVARGSERVMNVPVAQSEGRSGEHQQPVAQTVQDTLPAFSSKLYEAFR